MTLPPAILADRLDEVARAVVLAQGSVEHQVDRSAALHQDARDRFAQGQAAVNRVANNHVDLCRMAAMQSQDLASTTATATEARRVGISIAGRFDTAQEWLAELTVKWEQIERALAQLTQERTAQLQAAQHWHTSAQARVERADSALRRSEREAADGGLLARGAAAHARAEVRAADRQLTQAEAELRQALAALAEAEAEWDCARRAVGRVIKAATLLAKAAPGAEGARDSGDLAVIESEIADRDQTAAQRRLDGLTDSLARLRGRVDEASSRLAAAQAQLDTAMKVSRNSADLALVGSRRLGDKAEDLREFDRGLS